MDSGAQAGATGLVRGRITSRRRRGPMHIHSTDVLATMVIAAGIVAAHTITEALFVTPEYTATIWIDADHDPIERLRTAPRIHAPLPPAPVPLPPSAPGAPARINGPGDVFRFAPTDPDGAQLRIILIEPSLDRSRPRP